MKVFHAYLDKELKVIHVDQSCPGLKIPHKYHYVETVVVNSIEKAREIDAVYRACERCEKQAKAGKLRR